MIIFDYYNIYFDYFQFFMAKFDFFQRIYIMGIRNKQQEGIL